MKTLVLAPFTADGLEALRLHGGVLYEPWPETGKLWDPEELGERLTREGFDALVIEADFVLEETLSAAPGLRFIGVCRGDVGPHVDLEAAAERGVVVVNTPGRNAVAVAELTVGLMLALARRIPDAHTAVRRGDWHGALDGYSTWQGTELAGKTAGLVGFGAVGRQVARRLLAFDMTLLAYDPHVLERSDAKGVRFVALAELLQRSDFVSLHAALTCGTRGLLSERELGLMRRSAFLINTARAAIVDEEALLAALREQRIAGAALDVHSIEPLPPNSPWLRLDNVILTPHMGGATADVARHQSHLITDDLGRWLRGERPLNLLSRNAGLAGADGR